MHVRLNIFVTLLPFLCDQRPATPLQRKISFRALYLYMWMELVPPLLFITRFLRALLQSSLSLQTLFWLFSEGGLHLYCQETIRPPRDIFLRAVLEPSIQSFAAALNICFMTCGLDFNGKGRVINEVPLQRRGEEKKWDSCSWLLFWLCWWKDVSHAAYVFVFFLPLFPTS